MPALPPLPELTQPQFDRLVAIFTKMAKDRSLAGPSEAYIRYSLDNLISLVQADAYAQAEVEIEAVRKAKRAEVDAMLSDLLGTNPA